MAKSCIIPTQGIESLANKFPGETSISIANIIGFILSKKCELFRTPNNFFIQ